MGLLYDEARDVIAKSYSKLGDLTLLRMRNHSKGFGKSDKQKQLYLQSRLIVLNLRSVIDHISFDDLGNISYLVRLTPDQLSRFTKTLASIGELDKFAVAPTLYNRVKPFVKNIGKDAPYPKFQYSIDGSSWHDVYLSGDAYFRVSTNDGLTYSPAILFIDYPLVNAKVSKSGDTMSGNLIVPNGTLSTHAVNKGQLDSASASANAYADSLVVGLWDDRGSFSAAGGAYPSFGGSGTAGAIKKGDIWTISVAGTLPTGQVVDVGDTVRALIDSPGNTQGNWAIQQNNIGYVPVNKSGDTMSGNLAMSGNKVTGAAPATANGECLVFEQLNYLTAQVSISSAEILNSFASPKVLVGAPGVNKVIVPVSIITKLKYNSAAYATNTTIDFKIGAITIGTLSPAFLAATTSNVALTNSFNNFVSVFNTDLVFQVRTGNPTAGDGTLTILIHYVIIDMA